MPTPHAARSLSTFPSDWCFFFFLTTALAQFDPSKVNGNCCCRIGLSRADDTDIEISGRHNVGVIVRSVMTAASSRKIARQPAANRFSLLEFCSENKILFLINITNYSNLVKNSNYKYILYDQINFKW